MAATGGTWSKPLAAGGQLEAVSLFDGSIRNATKSPIKGMKIYFRKIDQRVSGIQVYYDKGNVMMHGDQADDFKEFHLERGDAIRQVNAYSGSMVNSLKFTTISGHIYGPYGGPGGEPYELQPLNKGIMTSIKGKVVVSNGTAITFLSFFWEDNKQHCHNPEPALKVDYGNVIGNLEMGRDVQIIATAPTSNRFEIDFCSGPGKGADIPLHLCFHMDKKLLFFNVRKKGYWLNFDKSGIQIPFLPRVEFKVKVYSSEDGSKVEIDGKELHGFEELLNPEYVTYLRISGLSGAVVTVIDD